MLRYAMTTATSLISGSKVCHMVKHTRWLCSWVGTRLPHYTTASAGIDASVLVQAKQMQVCARLRDVVVTDVNPNTVHRKVSNRKICVRNLNTYMQHKCQQPQHPLRWRSRIHKNNCSSCRTVGYLPSESTSNKVCLKKNTGVYISSCWSFSFFLAYL